MNVQRRQLLHLAALPAAWALPNRGEAALGEHPALAGPAGNCVDHLRVLRVYRVRRRGPPSAGQGLADSSIGFAPDDALRLTAPTLDEPTAPAIVSPSSLVATAGGP